MSAGVVAAAMLGLGILAGTGLVGQDRPGAGTPAGALRAAVVTEDRGAVLDALARGAQPDTSLDGTTALHVAARHGDPGIVRALLDAGADPDLPDPAGWTALHHAAAAGHAPALTVLLSAGADRSARTHDGEAPLELAIRARHSAAASVLLEPTTPCRGCRPR